ncbi:MAG: hypothetical protein HQL36_05755 [Alphaproteobacteria bacterium]|nr:hypothetical protein [Alphaproteobacteria bacterium]MBF0250399.1 hypothetical protein [Alphaproteobacteria bacterium]
MKTVFERPSLANLAEVNAKAYEGRYIVTMIRPGASEISREMITAPGLTPAEMRARQFFPGARILSVEAVPAPLPVRAARDTALRPDARFIRGSFRPALRGSDDVPFLDLND